MPTYLDVSGNGYLELGSGGIWDHIQWQFTTLPNGVEVLDDTDPARIQRAGWFAPAVLATAPDGDNAILPFLVVWIDFQRMLWPCPPWSANFDRVRYHIYHGGVANCEVN